LVNSVAKEILANKPLFGICLGHQVIGLANGFRLIKCLMGIEGSIIRKEFTDGKGKLLLRIMVLLLTKKSWKTF
jgi:carbamoylphosphate synthase small subunit